MRLRCSSCCCGPVGFGRWMRWCNVEYRSGSDRAMLNNLVVPHVLVLDVDDSWLCAG